MLGPEVPLVLDVSPLTAAASIGIVALGLALPVLVDAWWGTVTARSAMLSLGVEALGVAVWLIVIGFTQPEVDERLILPTAALAGLAAVLVTVPVRLQGCQPVVTAAYAGAWTLAVYTPVAIALFSSTEGFLGATLATLDLAGALPVLVASGAGGAAILLLERRNSPTLGRGPSRAMAVLGTFVAVWPLWLLWLVGLELALDEVTGRIILNGVIAPVASAIAWLVVQRVRHARTTPAAAVGGLLCGLIAITPGCGHLDAVGALLTGAIAGALCSLVGYAVAARTGQAVWLLVTMLVLAAGTGIVLLGAFATRAGLMFTGQPEVLFSQFASALIVIVFALVASILVWIPVRRIGAIRLVRIDSRPPRR